jgi:hypothetical protein
MNAAEREKHYEMIKERGDFERIVAMVKTELEDACRDFAPFNSPHEGYAVILEELEEMWADIKVDKLQDARIECLQVAAMAFRFLLDTERML